MLPRSISGPPYYHSGDMQATALGHPRFSREYRKMTLGVFNEGAADTASLGLSKKPRVNCGIKTPMH
ncbi:hypothetical protein H0H92_013742 [Tricholoma furcatifolium]|nr:hypothetical protein H0H92_013742 [Tricholoma furcatifolium]